VGKSTLLHALARFIPSEGGLIAPQRFGFAFQSYAVFPFLTVAGNLSLGIHGLSDAAKVARVDEYLRLVEMEEK
jgi:ABC-type nitrate/sulfonate/bicarbonate transport system ATPase subunit